MQLATFRFCYNYRYNFVGSLDKIIRVLPRFFIAIRYYASGPAFFFSSHKISSIRIKVYQKLDSFLYATQQSILYTYNEYFLLYFFFFFFFHSIVHNDLTFVVMQFCFYIILQAIKIIVNIVVVMQLNSALNNIIVQ